MTNDNTTNLAGPGPSETPPRPFEGARAATQKLLDYTLNMARTPEVEQVIAECRAELKLFDALEEAIALQSGEPELATPDACKRINASIARAFRGCTRAKNVLPVSVAQPVPPPRSRALGSDGREQIRRQSPGQRRGPPEPDPQLTLTLLAQLVSTASTLESTLVALQTQLVATMARPANDWIPQSEAPCPVRVFTVATRKYRAQGDDRAVVRGRVHYMHRSLLDEFLRGAPQAKRAPANAPADKPLSDFEKFQRELDLVLAEAAE